MCKNGEGEKRRERKFGMGKVNEKMQCQEKFPDFLLEMEEGKSGPTPEGRKCVAGGKAVITII